MSHINNQDYIQSLSPERQKQIESIKSAINSHYFVSQRINALTTAGIETETAPMGSGGVGQIKELQSGKLRVQVGHGTSKHNYATVAII